MRPTRVRTLLAVLLLAGAASWAGLRVYEARTGGALPDVPWSAPLALLGATAVLLALTLNLRMRLRARRAALRSARPHLHLPAPDAPPRPAPARDRPVGLPAGRPVPPVDPFLAARSVALAKACAHVGALVAGLYLGYLVFLLPNLDTAVRRTRALVCLGGAGAALLLVAVALFLERVCRLPEDDDDPHLGSPA